MIPELHIVSALAVSAVHAEVAPYRNHIMGVVYGMKVCVCVF